MSGSLCWLPHMPSWCVQEHLAVNVNDFCQVELYEQVTFAGCALHYCSGACTWSCWPSNEFFKNNFILYFIFQYWFYCGLKYGIELHSTARFRFPSSKAVNCYPWLKIECQLCCTGSFSIHISPTFNIITVDQTLMAPIQFQSLLGYLVLP